jgi:hypothetical protein
MFAKNLTLLVRVEKVVPQHVLARRCYGSRDGTYQRRIRRLMNEVVRPTLDVVIIYASALNVDASDLAFGTDGVFNSYEPVEDRFVENMKMYANQYKTYQLARRLYPNKRVIDDNDCRKLQRLVQGVTQPRMDDIVNLAGGLGISPAKLCFGRL